MDLKDNWYYWEISLKNPELPGEEVYTRDVVIVDRQEYCDAVNRLRELIITYCTLSEIIKNRSFQTEILRMIDEFIINTENIQYTEFAAFWKSLDTTYSVYRALDSKTRLKTLETILNRYCERRRKLYDQLGYTHVIQQALYDSASARSQGATGVKKVQQLLEHIVRREVPVAESAEEFENQTLCILLPDKNKKAFNDLKLRRGIKYSFGDARQNKLPDILIKIGSIVLVLEAKHIKEPGGAQDKQVAELIDYIRQNDSVHYVAFLDGLYFNFFREPAANTKPYKQRQDIEAALNQYPQNYFVNTAGLYELLRDTYSDIPSAGTIRETTEGIYHPRSLFERED